MAVEAEVVMEATVDMVML